MRPELKREKQAPYDFLRTLDKDLLLYNLSVKSFRPNTKINLTNSPIFKRLCLNNKDLEYIELLPIKEGVKMKYILFFTFKKESKILNNHKIILNEPFNQIFTKKAA